MPAQKKQSHPPEYFEKIYKLWKQGITSQELADKLGKEKGTVDKYIIHARKQFDPTYGQRATRIETEINILDAMLGELDKGQQQQIEEEKEEFEPQEELSLIDDLNIKLYNQFKFQNPIEQINNQTDEDEFIKYLVDLENYIGKHQNIFEMINHLDHIAWLKTPYAQDLIRKQQQETDDLLNDPEIAKLVNFDPEKLGDYKD